MSLMTDAIISMLCVHVSVKHLPNCNARKYVTFVNPLK